MVLDYITSTSSIHADFVHTEQKFEILISTLRTSFFLWLGAKTVCQSWLRTKMKMSSKPARLEYLQSGSFSGTHFTDTLPSVFLHAQLPWFPSFPTFSHCWWVFIIKCFALVVIVNFQLWLLRRGLCFSRCLCWLLSWRRPNSPWLLKVWYINPLFESFCFSFFVDA